MNLSDVKLRSLKSKAKPYRVADGLGLYVQVATTGQRLWRYKYRFGGKEKLLALGMFPEVTLKTAREKLMMARAQLATGADPGELKKQVRVGVSDNTFQSIAAEWMAKFSPDWSPLTLQHTDSRFRRLVFPYIGKRPINDVRPADVLSLLRRIEDSGHLETAHRVMQRIGEVFRYAVSTLRAERDITSDLRGALPPAKVEHMAAITEPRKFGELLRAIDGYEGSPLVKIALQLAPLVFVRPGELRTAEWAEFDLANAQWNLPAEKMKLRRPHIVPLARQSLRLITELRHLTGDGRFLFTNGRSNSRPMSNAATNAALRRMGYARRDVTSHGFRATARTLLDEVLCEPVHIIEQQLAHAVKDPTGRAYNRTAHLVQRTAMMQRWADYLDDLRARRSSTPHEEPET